MAVPDIRIRAVNGCPARPDGRYVLYWMVSYRRQRYNQALERAVEWCEKLKQPLLILEALRLDYPWASHRFHRFVIEGMAYNRQHLDYSSVRYYPYVERRAKEGRGLLRALAAHASVVVTDDYPCFFIPAMLGKAADRLDVQLEAVDSNGLLPVRQADRTFSTAHSFRAFLQKYLPPHLEEPAAADSLAGIKYTSRSVQLPDGLRERWPEAQPDELLKRELADIELPDGAGIVSLRGGAGPARHTLSSFLEERLSGYDERRNEPALDHTSRLSPYLHFGHISTAEVFVELARKEGWEPSRLNEPQGGSRKGWWGMSADAEAFLDELITWRELGFNMSEREDDYGEYESLPDWARETLEQHEADERKYKYSLPQFRDAATHDDIWNAAQRQLLREGRIHGYMRMLWGKKILHWSASPREALEIMIELNNGLALDGRDPNSYSGIFWVLGRYDRAWGPERPIFGKVRYMTSDSTARKLDLGPYLERYSE